MRKLTGILLLILFNLPQSWAQSEIVIINGDSQGEGLNDPATADPVGGNTGTTLGEQRLIALEYAAQLLSHMLSSTVTIEISADFIALGGDAFAAALGQAGPTTFHYDFVGAPQQNMWYVQALANKLVGTDLTSAVDIAAEFNSDVDSDSVLGSNRWYYGLDQNPPEGHFDLVTVALHEFLHGVGFISLVDPSTGKLLLDRPDAYSALAYLKDGNPTSFTSQTNSQRLKSMVATGDLLWDGTTGKILSGFLTDGVNNTRPELYAPDPIEAGSTLSHVSDDTTPNDLMEPAYLGPNHDATFGASFLSDIGWGNLGELSAHIVAPTDPAVLNADVLYQVIVANNGPQTAPSVTLDYALPDNTSLIGATSPQGSCTQINHHLECALGDLAANSLITIDLTLQFQAPANKTHTVQISGNMVDTKPTNNTSTLETRVASEAVSITADAGDNQLITSGLSVTLNGSSNVDDARSIQSYQWKQLTGPIVILTNSDTLNPEFTAPDSYETLIFQLTVTDDQNNTASDVVSLLINQPPAAHAGADQTVLPNAEVTLSANGSTDSDGQINSYLWEQVGGAQSVTISNSDQATASFQAPGTDDSLTFRVHVTDNSGGSSTDEVTITINRSISSLLNSNKDGGLVSDLLIYLLFSLCILRRFKYRVFFIGGFPLLTTIPQ